MGTPPQNPPAQERFVFLCHSMPDKELVRQIYVKLKQNGFTPWLDEENLEAGHDWEYEIHRAVHRASAVIVCLSKNSLTREGFVHREIKLALDVADRKPEGTVFIIPLRLEDCDVPQRLNRWHWVDYFTDNGFDKLLKSLQNRLQPLAHENQSASSAKKPQSQSDVLSKSSTPNPTTIASTNQTGTIPKAHQSPTEDKWRRAMKEAEEEVALARALQKAEEDAEWQRALEQVTKEVAREKAKQDALRETERERASRQLEAEWAKVTQKAKEDSARERARIKAEEDAEWKKLPRGEIIRPEVEMAYLAAKICIDNRDWLQANHFLKKIKGLRPGYRDVDSLIADIKTQVIRTYGLKAGVLFISFAVASVVLYLGFLAFRFFTHH